MTMAGSADQLLDEKFNLLDFSDEVLLQILLRCNSTTLLVLAKLAYRFLYHFCISSDENFSFAERAAISRIWSMIDAYGLWRTFDFSDKKMTAEEITHMLKYVTKETKVFKVLGLASESRCSITLRAGILNTLRTTCDNLESFEMHEGFLSLSFGDGRCR